MGEAKELTKIIIKGSSGYCAYSEAYKDRLTIEKGKISYISYLKFRILAVFL